MRSHLSLVSDHAMVIILLITAAVSLYKGEYTFCAVFAGLSSIKADLLRQRLRQEK